MALSPLPSLTDTHAVWASWYAEHAWPVFPCIGKRPLTPNGFYSATCNQQQITLWWSQWPYANIGHPLDATRFVLDIDPRHGGDNTLFALEQRYSPLPRTLQCQTGGGGAHLYWSAPPLPFTPGKIDLGEGLDIQKEGQYVILPPSVHPDTNRRYIWEPDFGPEDLPAQPCPAWLAALITAPGKTASRQGPGSALHTSNEPIPEGHREATLLSIAGAMQRLGASPAAIRAMLDTENMRCVPPLEGRDLDRLAESILRYPPEAQLVVPPPPPPGWGPYQGNGAGEYQSNGTTPGGGGMFSHPPVTVPLEQPLPNWESLLYAKKNGELYQNITNIKLILQNHYHWREPVNLLWWDSVRGRPMCGVAEIDETLMVDICDWFGRAKHLPVTRPALVEKCVITQCKKTPRDLLQEWLVSLEPWDGTPRLTSWLQKIAGARQITYAQKVVPPGEDMYTQDVSRVLLVSMVARALRPGCPYRYVVIFQGDEGIGKTALVRALAGQEWYAELSMNLENKEAHMMLQGVWVAELSELDSFTRTEETRLKSFITVTEDSYIPKFSNFREKVARRAVMIGTTNDECFLKGQSGNTRYLPLLLPQEVDLPMFQAMRDQLFAEAYQWSLDHPDDWWQLSSDALDQAVEERELRRVRNPYEQPLYEWLTDRHQEVYYIPGKIDLEGRSIPYTFTPGETTWVEIAQFFLRLDTPEKWKDRGLQMQIGAALRAIGWRVRQARVHGRNTNVWREESQDAEQ